MDRELKNLMLNINQLAAIAGICRQTAAARLKNIQPAGGHDKLKLYRVTDILTCFLIFPFRHHWKKWSHMTVRPGISPNVSASSSNRKRRNSYPPMMCEKRWLYGGNRKRGTGKTPQYSGT